MKALLQLAPRAGAAVELADALRPFARALRARSAPEGTSVVTLRRLDDDPLGPRTEYRATVEVSGDALTAAALTGLFAGVGERVAEFADPARSALLLAEELVFTDSGPAPIRYQYLMRRRSDFDHAAYLKRYRDVHAEFGLRTPGVLGYTQLHVDLDASRAAAEGAGIGVWEVDSVSLLHLASVEEFFAAVAKSPVPVEAREDEERFVDRASSRDFLSRVDEADAPTEVAR